ncbi:MAG: SMP-30/gluconolactonase/LRE family protein [Bacteroidales bacterium]|nr:SMP-30/gluconolactonase/LRE family protein [Bacteroidales bacterium]
MRNIRLNNLSLFVLVLIFSSFLTVSGQNPTARLLHKETALCGEGAIWHPNRKTLFWVDIDGKRLFEWNPSTGKNKEWNFDRMVSTVVPESKSSVVIALSDEIIRFNVETGKTDHIAAIETNHNAIRCNDGKCDPSGKLWIGTMTLKGIEGAGALFRLDGETPARMVSDVTISNGIVWTKDKKTMYYIDTPTQEIVAYDFDPKSGNISNRQVVITVPKNIGSPDGMTIDKDDMLWVAHWGGGGIYKWNPKTGKLIEKIGVPAPNVTSCAFGGDKLDTLFITTARGGLNEEQFGKYPLSGSLFYYIVPDTKGQKTNMFIEGKQK